MSWPATGGAGRPGAAGDASSSSSSWASSWGYSYNETVEYPGFYSGRYYGSAGSGGASGGPIEYVGDAWHGSGSGWGFYYSGSGGGMMMSMAVEEPGMAGIEPDSPGLHRGWKPKEREHPGGGESAFHHRSPMWGGDDADEQIVIIAAGEGGGSRDGGGEVELPAYPPPFPFVNDPRAQFAYMVTGDWSVFAAPRVQPPGPGVQSASPTRRLLTGALLQLWVNDASTPNSDDASVLTAVILRAFEKGYTTGDILFAMHECAWGRKMLSEYQGLPAWMADAEQRLYAALDDARKSRSQKLHEAGQRIGGALQGMFREQQEQRQRQADFERELQKENFLDTRDLIKRMEEYNRQRGDLPQRMPPPARK